MGRVDLRGNPELFFAPAKLTLSLRITGVRTDGFHLIDAEMVTLDFGDDLFIRDLFIEDRGIEDLFIEDGGNQELSGQVIEQEGSSLSIESQTGRGDPADAMIVPADSDNLILRALRLANRDAAVRLVKRIPPGAGLGGGSADAAAVLRWAGYQDLHGAASIGADIPFCLVGGRARVTGIGEQVEPLPFEEQKLTLLTPPFGCPTPLVYRAWDEMGGPEGDHGNDLESAALTVEPRLAQWRDLLGNASGQRPRLAGSGATWFVEGHHPVEGGRHVVTTPSPERSHPAET